MELLDQTVEKLFLRRPSDLAKFNGSEFFDLISNRVLADLYDFPRSLLAVRVVITFYSGWQRDELFPFKDEQESPADHIFQLAINLSPVPGLTDSTGDGCPAFRVVVGDYLLDEGNIILGNGAISINQDCASGHEVLHIRNFL